MICRSLPADCWFVVICCVTAFGCERGDNSAPAAQVFQSVLPGELAVEQPKKDGAATGKSIIFDGFVIHPAVVHENLTIFPVSRVEPSLEDRFITLDEGLRNGTVEVFELSAGARPDADHGRFFSPDEDKSGQPPVPPDSAAQLDLAPPAGDAPNAARDPDQAMQVNQGNAVNRVYVLNRSDRPLYLMPGEIILGGDQDRTIGEEIVIAPAEKPVEVEVFCVEHGRWGGRSAERTTQELAAAITNSASAQSIALSSSPEADENRSTSPDESAQLLSEQAENGRFVASVGVLTKKARLAAQGEKDQSKVWDEVAVANASAKSQIDSGAFTQNYVHADNIQRFEGFVEALQDRIAATDNVVGVVVAVNGRIDAADVFESTPLFRKLWPKLLKSYSLEAANRVSDSAVSDSAVSDSAIDGANGEAGEESAVVNETAEQKSQPVTCTVQDAVAFLQQAKAASETVSEVKDGQAISHRSDASLDSFSLRLENPDAAASAGGGFGGGGFGGAVHFSGFSK